ncbi:DUF427 domain-containing protein [Steroidobacter cummioxidans]|uniref:DUF427 domain-containing protein n=1 Tax=Steroidobacter cummioxidans TaxID=1803913 RepID=UPI000E30FE92|nr:DUF427 domain-containing protein [Steroidobacter cummioxidans]
MSSSFGRILLTRRELLQQTALIGAVTAVGTSLVRPADVLADNVSANRILIEPSPRWVRVKFNNVVVGNTKRALLVHELVPNGWKAPAYFFPKADIRSDLLTFSGQDEAVGRAGPVTFHHIEASGKRYENAALTYDEPLPGTETLADHVGFVWRKADEWLEEEETIYQHPRDPYHRVDALPSSRHIRIELGGEVIADTRRPVIVYETGLRPRYYIPRTDVREEFLERTNRHTRCPYKGEASYWSASIGGRTYDNIVWAYPHTFPGVSSIAGLLSFYNENVDAVYVDGVKEVAQRWNGGADAFYV